MATMVSECASMLRFRYFVSLVENRRRGYWRGASNELLIRVVRYLQTRSNSSFARSALGTKCSAPLIPLKRGTGKGKEEWFVVRVVMEEEEEIVFKTRINTHFSFKLLLIQI
jgi:hypothetical protein